MSVRIVTISEGADLVAAAKDFASQGRAWARAAGPLSAVELRRAGHEAQTLDGDLLLVSLEGPCEGPLVGLVSVRDPLSTHLVAGEVLAALTSATTTMCILHESVTAAPKSEVLVARAAEVAPAAPSLESQPALPPSSPHAVDVPRDAAPARISSPNVTLAAAIPARPVKAAAAETEMVFPDAGDRVEHFAFGSCEVLKSDGDRLHLRLGKDGKIKEIAVEMLKVSELPSDGAPGRRFKLERRL